jgi:hypothetical protein
MYVHFIPSRGISFSRYFPIVYMQSPEVRDSVLAAAGLDGGSAGGGRGGSVRGAAVAGGGEEEVTLVY